MSYAVTGRPMWSLWVDRPTGVSGFDRMKSIMDLERAKWKLYFFCIESICSMVSVTFDFWVGKSKLFKWLWIIQWSINHYNRDMIQHIWGFQIYRHLLSLAHFDNNTAFYMRIECHATWMDGWIRLMVGFQPLMVISCMDPSCTSPTCGQSL